MGAGDTAFTGNIPDLYQQHLVPLLFRPWAEMLAERIVALHPRRVVEMAAGTGVLTSILIHHLHDAEIVATDLNPAMLDVARRTAPPGAQANFLAADACSLPFDEGGFDVAASQFGVMFYPDRVKGYSEAARVLAPNGTYFALVWGSLVENPVSQAIQQAMDGEFEADPPRFLARTPFGYHDADTILAEAHDGGFEHVSVERFTLPHPKVPAVSAAEGLILGSPLRAEVEERGKDATARALEAAGRALQPLTDEEGRIDSEMTALLITARR